MAFQWSSSVEGGNKQNRTAHWSINFETGVIATQQQQKCGCGSVGRAVAFNTRGPQFDFSHWQNSIEHLFIINCIEKTKINKKRPGMAHFF